MKNITYDQIAKNTVKAENQLKNSKYITFENPEGKGLRVLFVGNSITRHGVAPEIGWYNDCGMAASSKDKDYVHQLIAKINGIKEDAVYCICHASAWEREFKEGTDKLQHVFQSAYDFNADVIIFRLIENCRFQNSEAEVFKSELCKFLACLNPTGKAQVILTTSFWHHPGDEVIREFARENNIAVAELGDLGELDEMKAIGLFEHAGVANHPGNLGMQKIAERIFEKIKFQ